MDSRCPEQLQEELGRGVQTIAKDKFTTAFGSGHGPRQKSATALLVKNLKNNLS
jgi:hypothetical protein